MAIKTELELSTAASDLWKRAKSAADSNNRDYAINLIQSVLKVEPSFLDGRQRLRALEIQKYKAQSSMTRQLSGVKNAAAGMRAAGVLKKNPTEAMNMAEEILALDPYNAKGNEILSEAALALDLPEISLLTHETLADERPDDKKNLHAMAQLCLRLKDFNRAISVYERILKVDPRDGDAQSGLKNASAQLASSTGGWEQSTQSNDFRSALRNKDEAVQLEQENRVTKSDEAIGEQIARLSMRVQTEPTNLNHPRQIADLYLQQEDFENAVVWYQYTFEQGGKTDVALEKKVGDLQLKKVDQDLRAAVAALEAEPERDDLKEYLQALTVYRKELQLQTAQLRVQRYPSDKQYHFDLGKAYAQLERYKEALPELQIGKQQPNVRFEAANLLGVCHWKLNMLDLAERGLSQAAAEIPVMNDIKKEILYNLGLVLEASGKKAEGTEVLKQIYETDIGYKDVAARVEGSYAGG